MRRARQERPTGEANAKRVRKQGRCETALDSFRRNRSV